MFIISRNWYTITAKEPVKYFNMTIFVFCMDWKKKHEIDIQLSFFCIENESQNLIVYYLENEKLKF